MGRAGASVEVAAPLADVWELLTDPARWASWVDGFDSLIGVDGFPEVGGTATWRSTPAGRGTVTERVLENEPRRLLRTGYEDPGSSGEVRTTVAIVAEGGNEPRTRIEQEVEYSPNIRGPLRPLIDWLFVRPQMRRSLERSLAQLRLEAGVVMGGFEPPEPA